MNGMMLSGVRACVFDAYGTLFDPASAAARCSVSLGGNDARLTALWRDKQLQYSWLRTIEGKHADFWQVTREALDFALEAYGLADPGLREHLMQLYATLTPFPDARDCLWRLRQMGLLTAILSNGTPEMLASMVEASQLGQMFDALLSVEEAGIYKPYPSVYQLAVDRLGIPAQEIAFLSSNGWDAYGASSFGLRVVWCNRLGWPRERLPGSPDREIRSLAELPALLGAA